MTENELNLSTKSDLLIRLEYILDVFSCTIKCEIIADKRTIPRRNGTVITAPRKTVISKMKYAITNDVVPPIMNEVTH